MADGSADPESGREQPGPRGGAGSGTLVVSDTEGYVGDTITFKGRNLPPGESYEIQWHTSDGQWGVVEAHEIIGTQFRPRTETVATVETDDQGTFDEEWTIPEDYGGDHSITLVDGDGQSVAQTEFHIRPWFEIDRTEAPLGGSFTVTGYGLGPDVMRNNYQIAWDNGYVGFMTGVQNRGTATAPIRAVGPPGKHVLQVWRNYRGIPYLLNNTQSPFGDVAGGRQTAWTVEVTESETEPQTAWMDQLFDESPISTHYPDIDEDTEATLSITPQSGQAGTTATIRGTDFPPNEAVELTWYRHEGHDPQGTSATPSNTITAQPKPDVLPDVTTDGHGEFEMEVEIPRDIGSTRPITAAVGGREVAVTGFMLQPSIERFEPTSGPVGTEIQIELSGVGWTMYENAPMFLYDNDPLGYLCGTGGDAETGTVNPVLYAAGEPGWHFIDAYPSLFKYQQDEPDFELEPHLSYLDNHPVRPLPAFHFAFKVTE